MTSETQKTEELLSIMDTLEQMNRLNATFAAVSVMPYEMLSPALWAAIQNDVASARGLLNLMRESLKLAPSMIDNDAFRSHLNAVCDTPN